MCALLNFSFFPLKVSNIWYNHLLRIVQLRTKTPATQQGIGPLISEQLEEEDSLGIVERSAWHKSVTIYVYATCMFISKTSKLWLTCTSTLYYSIWCDYQWKAKPRVWLMNIHVNLSSGIISSNKSYSPWAHFLTLTKFICINLPPPGTYILYIQLCVQFNFYLKLTYNL